MRTTLTLDPDVEAMLKRVVRERRVSFKEAVNDSIRAGLRGEGGRTKVRPPLPLFDMGQRADVSLDRALRVSDAMEDEELVRKLALGK